MIKGSGSRTSVKKLGVLMLTFALAVSMMACGTDPDGSTSGESFDESGTEDGKIIVDFWHSMGGSTAEALEGLIDDFHKSQDGIEVNLTYLGSMEWNLNLSAKRFIGC